MQICRHCGSTNLTKRGGNYTTSKGVDMVRYSCSDCGRSTSTQNTLEPPTVVNSGQLKTMVLTSAKNGTDTHREFFRALQTYVSHNDCDFYVLPTRHKNQGEAYVPEFDNLLEPFILHTSLEIPDYKLKIFGNLKLSASIENPLSGLDPLSKGSTLIVGHPQVQLRTLPRIHEKYPPILTTTGSVSVKSYKDTKPGVKANFNHAYSAVVIEFDEVNDEKFVHIRHLNYDESNDGFYDIDTFYSSDGSVQKQESSCLAIVTGDEHALFADSEVKRVTYTNVDSMVNVLKPVIIVRHDVFDAHSISHHHKQDSIKRYKKYRDDSNSLEAELKTTVDHIISTTPKETSSYIVGSNHNEHLYRWLNECDPKKEPWNAKLYHKLMYMVLDEIDQGAKDYDPFELYCKDAVGDRIRFVKRNDRFEILGIWLGSHGDIGSNGARGSRQQFAILPSKSIIGHSHSPGIEKGCYQVGTSSKLNLDYNVGASSWHHAHCIVHNNGKRQLLFITNGKYRK
jgi:hypothetical protein